MQVRKRKSVPSSPPSATCSSLRSSSAVVLEEAKLSHSDEFTNGEQQQPKSPDTPTSQTTQQIKNQEGSTSPSNSKENAARWLNYQYHPFVLFAARDQPTVLQFLKLSSDDEGDSQVKTLRAQGYLVTRLLQDNSRPAGDDLKFVLHGGDWREAYGINNTGYFHQLKRPPPPAAMQVGINRMWTFTAAQLEHQRKCVSCYYTCMDHKIMRSHLDVEIPVTKANKIVKENNKPTRVFMEEMAKYMHKCNAESSDSVDVTMAPATADSNSSVASAENSNTAPVSPDAAAQQPYVEPRLVVYPTKKKKKVKAEVITLQTMAAQFVASQAQRATPSLPTTPTVANIINEYSLPSISPSPMKVVEMNGTRFHSCRRTPPVLSPSPSPAPTVRSLSSNSAGCSPVSTTTTLRLSPYPALSSSPLPRIMEMDYDSHYDDTHSNTSTLEQEEAVLEHRYPDWWVKTKPHYEPAEYAEAPDFSLERAMKRSKFDESASLFHHTLPAIEDNYFTGF